MNMLITIAWAMNRNRPFNIASAFSADPMIAIIHYSPTCTRALRRR